MIKICSSLRPLHPLLYDKRNDFGNTPFNLGLGITMWPQVPKGRLIDTKTLLHPPLATVNSSTA